MSVKLDHSLLRLQLEDYHSNYCEGTVKAPVLPTMLGAKQPR
jgi:hypothetical protein